jgi:hypothetical protein
MSHVANVIVWTMPGEEEAIAPVQEWLKANNHGPLTELGDFTHGHRRVEAEWWGVAANYLDIEAFLAVVFAQNWEFPDSVCIVVQDQHDDQPAIVRRGETYGGYGTS